MLKTPNMASLRKILIIVFDYKQQLFAIVWILISEVIIILNTVFRPKYNIRFYVEANNQSLFIII